LREIVIYSEDRDVAPTSSGSSHRAICVTQAHMFYSSELAARLVWHLLVYFVPRFLIAG
jgi:hypothetical protein